MLDNKLFKIHPISYTQFLQPKNQHVHYLSEIKGPIIDIELFQKSIALHYQQIYTAKKWQHRLYRSVFFGFSLLFFILSILIFFKTVNFDCGIFFKNCILVKNCINSLCFVLSGGAFFMGYKIHPERDAIQHLVSKVELAPYQTLWTKKH